MFKRRFRNERFLVVWERFWDRVFEHSHWITWSKRRSKIDVFSWFGINFGIGFWWFVLNYVIKTRFKNQRFLMVWNWFWDRVFKHSYWITLSKLGSQMNASWRSGTGFGIEFRAFVFNYVFKTCLEVSDKERVLERSYSITCSKGRCKNCGFLWSGTCFWIGMLSIRIELHV